MKIDNGTGENVKDGQLKKHEERLLYLTWVAFYCEHY
jgi:hypothetical protein